MKVSELRQIIKEEVIDLGAGVELTMVLIPKGKFLMGSPVSGLS